MDGKVFALIARKGAGKSYFIKEKILSPWGFRKTYIIDWNDEYTAFKNEFTLPTSKENFLQLINERASHKGARSNIIFEEATHFLRKMGNTDGRVISQITRTFHTKNIVVFVFHSMLAVPHDFFPNIDFWVIFQTQDNPHEVRKHYKGREDILNAYLDVYEKTKGTLFDRANKTYPDEYSKNFYHYKKIIAL